MELQFVGGVYGNIRPTEFLCLTLKLLQIQPEKEIILEYINQEDFKYLRALGAFYLRITGSAKDNYQHLEPLLNDYSKLRCKNRDGHYILTYMDEFIDNLLREERVCDTILVRMTKRYVLEELEELEPYTSLLDEELLNEMDDTDDSDDMEDTEDNLDIDQAPKHLPEPLITSEIVISNTYFERRKPKTFKKAKELFKKPKQKSIPIQDNTNDFEKGGAAQDSLSIEETNKMRAKLGLKPLSM